MKYGSLFAGIGGIDLGLDRAGMECAWQVEIDPYCRKVLTKHWPDVPKYTDIRECGKHNLEQVDLICGGFPCQDISLAGKGAGINGKRSGLWAEYYRIICELRPRIVLVENVSALLIRGLDRVLGDLAEGGYDAEWDCIPASAVGAPHRRDRVFIIARDRMDDANGEYGNGEVYKLNKKDAGKGRCRGDDTGRGRGHDRWKPEPCEDGDMAYAESEQVPESGDCCGAEDVANTWCSGSPRQGQHEQPVNQETGIYGQATRPINGSLREIWRVEPNVGRVAHGVPKRVDRLRGLGNAVVPQVAEYIGKMIMENT